MHKILIEAALSRISPRIKHLILHVTNRCDMRCRHCFVDLDKEPNDLGLAEFKIVANNLSDLIWLDIGGGEPTLREDIEDIVGLFRFEELSIPTNGWEVERITKILSRIHNTHREKLIVTLSLEGLEATHDSMRREGSFVRTLATFKHLKELKGIRIKFNTVLCEENYKEIVDLMLFVKRLNPDFHSILMLRGRSRDPLMQLPSIQRIRDLEKDIYRIQQSYNYGRKGILSRVQRNYQAVKRDLALRILQEKRQAISCLAGACHLVVWADGNVSCCELLKSFGNLREDDFADLLKSSKMRESVAAIKRGDCFCTHDCNMIENILFNPKSYWKLL